MLPLSFARTVVTVDRPGLTNDHGALVPDYTDVTTHTVPGCVVQPGGTSSDPIVGLTRADRIIHAPVDADLRAYDRLTLPGDQGHFYVGDEPVLWPSPTGSVSHVLAVATRYQPKAL